MASLLRWKLPKSRSGRRPISVAKLLKRESEGKVFHKHGFKLDGETTFQGLDIAIENGVGSTRKGKDKDGTPWSVTYSTPYGYIRGTKGADDEEVDAYVGPKKDADTAFVVHQKKDDGSYDEDTVMLGYGTKAEAKKDILEHYSDPKYVGDIVPVAMTKLIELVDSGKKLVKIALTSVENGQTHDYATPDVAELVATTRQRKLEAPARDEVEVSPTPKTETHQENAITRPAESITSTGGFLDTGKTAADIIDLDAKRRAKQEFEQSAKTGPIKSIEELDEYMTGPHKTLDDFERSKGRGITNLPPHLQKQVDDVVYAPPVRDGGMEKLIGELRAADDEVHAARRATLPKPRLGMGKMLGIAGAVAAPIAGYAAYRAHQNRKASAPIRDKIGSALETLGEMSRTWETPTAEADNQRPEPNLSKHGPFTLSLSEIAPIETDQAKSAHVKQAFLNELDAIARANFVPPWVGERSEFVEFVHGALAKEAEIDKERALEALQHLEELEHQRPTAGQLARGAALGSIVGPVASNVSKLVSHGKFHSPREVAGQIAGGVVFGTAMPIAKYKADTGAERRVLKNYVNEHGGRLASQIENKLGVP